MRAILKMINIFHIARDKRKTLKRGKNKKRKVQEKFNNVTMTIKFFKFYFLHMEKEIFCSKL